MARIRLAAGDYYQPGDLFEARLRRNAVAYFLETIYLHQQRVLKDLKKTVLPAYVAATEGLHVAGRSDEEQELRGDWPVLLRPVHPEGDMLALYVNRHVRLQELVQELPNVQELAALHAAAMEWAARHHLDLPQFHDTALATVAAWAADPKRRHVWNHTRATRPVPSIGEGKPFTVSGWSPRGETKVEARRRMTAAVEEHLNQAEQEAVALGWKLSPTKGEIEQHVKWLALYQIGGATISQIGRQLCEPGEDAQSARRRVAFGIKSAGVLIAGDAWPEWKRAPSKGGRPKETG